MNVILSVVTLKMAELSYVKSSLFSKLKRQETVQLVLESPDFEIPVYNLWAAIPNYFVWGN